MAFKKALIVLYHWIRGHLGAVLGFVLGAEAVLLVSKHKAPYVPLEDPKTDDLERAVAINKTAYEAVKDPAYPVESLDEVRASLRRRGMLK